MLTFVRANRSDEGLTLDTSALESVLRWSNYVQLSTLLINQFSSVGPLAREIKKLFAIV